MKANKKTLLAFKNMIENEQEYWDLEELKSSIVEETKLLKHKDMGEHSLSPDECGIEWGEDSICVLDQFIDSYTQIFLEKICNMAVSMIGEDISCYFDED